MQRLCDITVKGTVALVLLTFTVFMLTVIILEISHAEKKGKH